jgi:hypothetical protein
MRGVRGHSGPPFLLQNIGGAWYVLSSTAHIRSAMILGFEGERTNGKRVEDCEADEE